MQRLHFFMLLLAAIIGAGVFLTQSSAPEGDGTPDEPEIVSIDPEADREPLPQSGRDDGASEAAERDDGVSEAAERDDGASEVAKSDEPDSADTVRVIVVDAAAERPVPGATVWFISSDDIDRDELKREPASPEDPADLFVRFGRQLRADGRGEVRVPRGLVGAAVAARSGRLFGSRGLRDAGEEPVRLEMTTQRTLVVQVVDEGGRPMAGVPVAFRIRGEGFQHDPVSATTGSPDGTAKLGIVDHFMKSDGTPGGLRFSVVSTVPLANVAETPIVPESWSGEPLRIVLPPTGRVVVVLADPGDVSLVADLGPVTLVACGAADENSVTPQGLSTSRLVAGRALFPIVGCGLRLLAFAKRPDLGLLRLETVPAAGPLKAGDEVVLRLLQSRWPNRVIGQAVDEKGESLSWVTVHSRQLTQANHGNSLKDATAKTDAEGRFELALDSTLPVLDSSHDFLLKIQGPDDEVPFFGRMRVSVVHESKEFDVGPVAFERGPPTAIPPHGLPRSMMGGKPAPSTQMKGNSKRR